MVHTHEVGHCMPGWKPDVFRLYSVRDQTTSIYQKLILRLLFVSQELRVTNGFGGVVLRY
jgi:hypothetical protein